MQGDFGLIRKMKQGDDMAFELFVRKYYEKILLYCHYHCADQEEAQDLTQETFVRFFTKLSAYHYRGKTLNYLYTIAGNLCRDYYRKERELPVADTEGMAEGLLAICTEGHQIEAVLDKVVLEQAMGQLPEELQEIVILYYFRGLKLTEISETLQIGLPLVKYRMKQARSRLKILLRKEGERFA